MFLTRWRWFVTSTKRIASITFQACTTRRMFGNMTKSILATNAWARIFTFVVQTCSVGWTIIISYTFWATATVGITVVFSKTWTWSRTIMLFANCICSARTGITWLQNFIFNYNWKGNCLWYSAVEQLRLNFSTYKSNESLSFLLKHLMLEIPLLNM